MIILVVLIKYLFDDEIYESKCQIYILIKYYEIEFLANNKNLHELLINAYVFL